MRGVAPTQTSDAAHAAPSLPVRTSELLTHGAAAVDAVALERRHGNADLFAILELLELAGPFQLESPWELRDETGRHLIHAGGFAASPFGEAYPPLVEFARSYLSETRQLGFPHQTASEWRAALDSALVALLASVAPTHEDSQVFLSNSGAEAVEAAMKLALAYRPKARRFVNFGGAYHGKTLGALSLTSSEVYQGPFRPLRETITLPYGDEAALAGALRTDANDVVAIVVEPVLGEGGVVSPPPGFLRRLGELASTHGVPVIADEVQTGLGRAGHWFASVAEGLEPDIVTLAKPLGGGLLPVGATIARREIFRAMLPGTASRRHSSTFGGGSFACAVALRSLELLVDERLDLRAQELGRRGLERMRATVERYPNLLADARGAGMLLAFTLRPIVGFPVPGVPADDVQAVTSMLGLRQLHEAGVHACFSLRGNYILRFTPPLNIPEALFDEMFDRIDAFAAANPRSLKLLQRFGLPRLMRLLKVAYG